MTDPIYDPPGYWRSEARKILAAGGSIEEADPLLCLTGPPAAYLEGISTDLRTVMVPSRPPFEASYWRTRMWHCLCVDLHYEPGNSQEGRLIKTGTSTQIRTCPNCSTNVLFETPTYLAKAVSPGYVQTFQRRFRAAWKALELQQVSGPTMFKGHPFGNKVLACWRELPRDLEISTDPRVDLDNIAKVLLDAMQEPGGKPGLLTNDRIVHLLVLDRIAPRRKK